MIKRALTVAGSDSSGGAGIQADLKTFSMFGVYGMSVLTAVTAQNTTGVHGMIGLDPDFVSIQFEAVLSDIGVDGIKTGMLFNSQIVSVVARKCIEHPVPYLVVDPVMESKSGTLLLDTKGVETLKQELLPLATLVLPNLHEAEVLAEIPIDSIDDMKEAAQIIQSMGCRAVLIKGGHLKEDPADILYDGHSFTLFQGKRIKTLNTHGTGCTYASAILANLVKEKSLPDAILISKAYITQAIQNSFSLGKGRGPLNHFVRVEGMD